MKPQYDGRSSSAWRRIAARVIAIVIVTLSVSAYSQIKLSEQEARAHYIYELVKHIKWNAPRESGRYVIGVIDDDPELMRALIVRKDTLIRGSAFSIETFDSTKRPATDYAVIFINKSRKNISETLFKSTTNTLLITDGRIDSAYQLASLVPSSAKLKIRLNHENLSARGFKASISLLELAGTKEDLTEELRDRQAHLTKVLKDVKARTLALEQLNTAYEANAEQLRSTEALLEQRSDELANREDQLITLTQGVELSRAKVSENQRQLETQKTLLASKQAELIERSAAIGKLQTEINVNQRTLDIQLAQLHQQGVTIISKNQKIGEQRGWLILAIIVVSVFFVLIYFLARANTLRKKANMELEQVNNQLYEMATIDGMTKLYNRRHFLEETQKELHRQQRSKGSSCMLMMDIDHFKNVNDTYGHAMGDKAIQAVARIFKDSLRKYDSVGRLGGEEYAMMLVDCDLDLAYAVADRLRDLVEQAEITYEENTVKITVSIGFSKIAEDDIKIEESISRADSALYRAKKQGRNRVVGFPVAEHPNKREDEANEDSTPTSE